MRETAQASGAGGATGAGLGLGGLGQAGGVAGSAGTVTVEAPNLSSLFGFDGQQQINDLFGKAWRSSIESQQRNLGRSFRDALSGAAADIAGPGAAAGNALTSGLGAALNPAQALAGAGPLGAGLAALAVVGERGADEIVDGMTGLVDAIGQGIAQLPELFGQVVAELPAAIARAVATAIKGLFGGGDGGGFTPFKGGLTARDILGIGTLGLSELTGFGAAASALNVPGFDSGTSRVTRTGIYKLHEGESVLPTSGSTSAATAARMGGGGPSVTMVIQAAAISPDTSQALNDQLSRELGAYGRGESALVGGL